MKRRFYLWLMAFLSVASGCGDGRWNTGDRVLVSKCQYESGLTSPSRYDVVVFKYPDEPTKRGTPYNYIKRLMGLSNEILAILFGRLYVFTPDAENPLPESFQDQGDPKEAWRISQTRPDSPEALHLFYAGKFKITRKPLEVMMAMRRPVFLNNHQPADLKSVAARWNPAEKSEWKTSADRKVLTFADKGSKDVDWVHYQNLVVYRVQDGEPGNKQSKPRVFENQGSLPHPPRNWDEIRRVTLPLDPKTVRPQLITDEMSYNSNLPTSAVITQGHWVGDLMLECKVKVAQAQGEFWMELSKGVHRYRARFNLADGECELFQVEGETAKSLGKKGTALKGAGTHSVRFANVDARLTVWVDGKLPFDNGVEYHPDEAPTPDEAKAYLKDRNRDALTNELLKRRGPTRNDLEPASLGVVGSNVEVSDIELWRDTYYVANGEQQLTERFNPERFGETRGQLPGTFYVPPGHYFCLGDNSPASSDSRVWGTVPRRLMLGRALMIYWPLNRIGTIR